MLVACAAMPFHWRTALATLVDLLVDCCAFIRAVAREAANATPTPEASSQPRQGRRCGVAVLQRLGVRGYTDGLRFPCQLLASLPLHRQRRGDAKGLLDCAHGGSAVWEVGVARRNTVL